MVDGMDEACKAIAPYTLSIYADTCDPEITEYILARGIRPDNYAMQSYPKGYPPASGDAIFMSCRAGIDDYVNEDQVDLFNQGIFFGTGNYEPADPNVEGEKIMSYIVPSHVKVYYLNPVVSSFSHYALRTSEQVEFTITGLAFDQDNAEIDQGGDSKPWPYWKSYVTEIEFWHMQAGEGEWEDDFEDDVRDPAWTDEPNNGTITEAGGVLTLAIANGVDGYWWQPNVENAPFVKLSPGLDKLTIITKLNSYTVNDQTSAGLMIGNTTTIPDTAGGYCIAFTRLRSDAGSLNGLYVRDMGKSPSDPTYIAETTLPIWLRIVANGSGAGSTIDFDYSTNGEDWTTLSTRNNLTWSLIGLHARNWGAPKNAISAPFEFFKYSWEAQPVSTLKKIDGDFTLDSDTQITIPKSKFPELSTGTYRLKLKKTAIDIASFLAEGWAGAWRPDGAGLCTAGAPLEIQVGLMPSIGVRGKAKALPLTCFTWKNKLGETYEDCVAPIDIRTPETFYDGRIIDVSSITRAIDHRTGLFQVSDMTIRLVNTDKKYSKLLANWFLKNQPINVWHATGFEPESSKTPVVGMIVEDYHLQGTQFVVKLKDITQKYFKKKIPPRICTELTFPQIHPDEIGKAFPEVLGLCVLGTEFENPGAVQAIYIDTLVYEYLAANGTLNSVTEVYSDGELKSTPADYSIVYRDGCTFIDFTAEQKTDDALKKITFNAQGYSVAGLNSINGYIQNPAYIIYYYLNNILEVPTELLNVASFDALASKYDDLGVGESGKLIIQKRQDSMEVLRQLFFTCGTHGFTANNGKFIVERKDIYNYATDLFLFDQVDLMDA
ncbi:MAG: hypothetical protein HWN68_18375, partial [Desulfobacterales bacterium]|nr:hypothetical protein [Desulfobacterales bacterium]